MISEKLSGVWPVLQKFGICGMSLWVTVTGMGAPAAPAVLQA